MAFPSKLLTLVINYKFNFYSLGIDFRIRNYIPTRANANNRKRLLACARSNVARTCGLGKRQEMKNYAVIATFSALLVGCADTRGAVRVEQSSAGKPYDFVVHVKNVPEIGYNPEVSTDRAQMALRLVRGQCPGARVVGQDTIVTEIYGITSRKPDYVVLVRCG